MPGKKSGKVTLPHPKNISVTPLVSTLRGQHQGKLLGHVQKHGVLWCKAPGGYTGVVELSWVDQGKLLHF